MSKASDDEEGIRLGVLIPLVFILAFGIGFRVCVEIIRRRKGLEDEESQTSSQEKKAESKKAPKVGKEQPLDKRPGKNSKTMNSRAINNKSPSSRSVKSNKSTKSNKSSKSNKSTKSNGNKSSAPPNAESKNAAANKKRPLSKGGSQKKMGQQPSPDLEDFAEGSLHSHDENEGNLGDFSFESEAEVLPGDTYEVFSEVKNDPNARKLYQHHLAGDWRAIRDFFDKIRRRIIERQHYIHLIVHWIESEWPGPIHKDIVYCDYLDEWNRAEPENLQCNVIRLEVWIAWAWHGRTKAFAHEIPPKRVELFYDRMDNAAEELERVLRVTKKRDALVYASAIKIATGRSDDQKIVQEYMQAVQQSNDPANYVFHTRAMEYFCEKWHGSHKEMMDYATWITSQLPDGHPLWILIPVAHYERAILMNSPAAQKKYWSQQKGEIVEAYDRALGGIWETTVNEDITPACMKLDAVVRNWFVYALGKCNATELARRQARVIGKHPLPGMPWDEQYTYLKHVKALGFEVEAEDWV